MTTAHESKYSVAVNNKASCKFNGKHWQPSANLFGMMTAMSVRLKPIWSVMSNLEFTHTFCDQCLPSHYPDEPDRLTTPQTAHSHLW